jgi:hypothetical protein
VSTSGPIPLQIDDDNDDDDDDGGGGGGGGGDYLYSAECFFESWKLLSCWRNSIPTCT